MAAQKNYGYLKKWQFVKIGLIDSILWVELDWEKLYAKING